MLMVRNYNLLSVLEILQFNFTNVIQSPLATILKHLRGGWMQKGGP